MSLTKRQIIGLALSELGLGLYIFDASPEELESARARLDNMAAQWDSMGQRFGYSISSGLDSPSGLPDKANAAYSLGLAIDIAPTYGKTVSRETAAKFSQAKNALYVTNYVIPQVPMPNTMPLGRGNRPDTKGRQYYDVPDPLLTGNDGEINFDA